MRDYKISLKLKSNFITSLQADTIWGHLAWAYRDLYGEAKLLDDFIKLVEGNPPIILTDAVPTNMLPMPRSPLTVKMVQNVLSKLKYSKGSAEWLKGISLAKRWQAKTHLEKQTVLDILSGNTTKEDILSKYILENIDLHTSLMSKHSRHLSSQHNVISRITGTTLEKHGLYQYTFWATAEQNHTFELYCKTNFSIDVLKLLFDYVSMNGYGKRTSTGHGMIAFSPPEELAASDSLVSNTTTAWFMTLSSCYVPAKDELPLDGYWDFFIKRGKLGIGMQIGRNQFLKYPVAMFKAGSLFKPNTIGKNAYGRYVKQDLPTLSGLVTFGFAYPIPAKVS